MNTTVNQTLYPLIRDYMKAMGTSGTTLVALKSYKDAVRRLKCMQGQFKPLLMELNAVIRDSEPTVVPLVHLIEEFEAEMQPHFDKELGQAKAKAAEILDAKLKRFDADTRKLTEQCMSLTASDDTIIVHSPTGYIRNAFVRAHDELNRSFKILILKQDFLRTKELVNALDEHHMDYPLIPEQNLSHCLAEFDKLFIGAVAITSDGKAVTGLGTANVVSICHAYHVPVYLFAESIKFSRKPLTDHNIYKEESYKIENEHEFRMTAYSHDFFDLHMVDHLITENGETTVESLQTASER
jgi:translation initiation factor eIF-2B subunit alpha